MKYLLAILAAAALLSSVDAKTSRSADGCCGGKCCKPNAACCKK